LSPDPGHPALEGLQARLAEEESAYAEVLGAIDRLSAFALPGEAAPEVRERLERLNALWEAPPRPEGGGLGGVLRHRAWDAVRPAVERQTAFNAALVQLLNAYLTQAEGLHARLRELAGALVRYAQRVEPVVDARDRVATALATTRAELILEAFDRRLELLSRRLDALTAARDALGTTAPFLDLATHGGDPRAELASQATGSLGAVLAGALADRPSPSALGELLAEAHRALRPGGLLVLEAEGAGAFRAPVEAAGFAVLDASSPERDAASPRPSRVLVARR
jgi:SAM-dependent methyltransferase